MPALLNACSGLVVHHVSGSNRGTDLRIELNISSLSLVLDLIYFDLYKLASAVKAPLTCLLYYVNICPHGKQASVKEVATLHVAHTR